MNMGIATAISVPINTQAMGKDWRDFLCADMTNNILSVKYSQYAAKVRTESRGAV